MNKRKSLSKNTLLLSILTTITIFTWIGFDIYYHFKKDVELQIPKEYLEPINPNLDKEILEKLKTRKTISKEELDSVPELTDFELKVVEASPSGEKAASPSGEEKDLD